MPKKLIDKRYKIIKRLGTVAVGEVYKVKDSKTNKIIALKILSKKNISPETVE